jgi:hypothetical protein
MGEEGERNITERFNFFKVPVHTYGIIKMKPPLYANYKYHNF